MQKAMHIGFFLLSFSAAVFASTPERALKVYYLPMHIAEQFDGSDSAISDFWGEWEDRDTILLTPGGNAYSEWEPFDGPGDARMLVKAAGSDSGLFILVTVFDDIWVDPPTQIDTWWLHERVDLFFDPAPAAILNNMETCYDSCFPVQYFDVNISFTRQTTQLQTFFVAPFSHEAGLLMSYDELWSPPVRYDWIPFGSDEPINYWGIIGEPMVHSDNEKSIEWYIPWNRISPTLSKAELLVPGRRLGFSCSYLDRDGVDSTVISGLFWLGTPSPAGPYHGVGNQCWGDLVLDQGFENALSVLLPQKGSRIPDASGRNKTFDIAGRAIKFGASAHSLCVINGPSGKAKISMHKR